MKRSSWILGLLCGLGLQVLLAAPAETEENATPRYSPDQAVFLLEYIGSDYDLAVRDGAVRNAFEYAEVLGFSQGLQEDFARARPGEGGPVPELLEVLTGLILAKEDGARVRETVSTLVPLLSKALGASAPPDGLADLARGRRVYVDHCQSCHGSEGAGDGPAAVGMEPPATSFLEARAQLLSVRQIAGATRFGIEGTAMAAFEDLLSRPQIHDVAFYVASLTQKAKLQEEKGGASGRSVHAIDPGAVSAMGIARALEDSFVGLVERISPAVVGVAALVADPSAQAQPSAGRVTRHGGWQRSESVASRHPGYTPTGFGSGFFVRPDGTLLTARHFLLNPKTGELADRIEVELLDDRRFLAWVVGLEPMLDLAVLRVDAPAEVPFVSLEPGQEATVGQWIIALGNPPGIERDFVVANLSATPRRECYQEEPAETLFQTSAWVEAGIFGGPVVDLDGGILGMAQPSPGSSPQPGSPNALRILPIELAETIYEALRVEAKKVSPWLGFSVLELSREIRRRLAGGPRTGIYIDDVFVPSPASRAGIKAGDVLVSVEGQTILSVPDFQRELYLAGVGREVELEIYRDRNTILEKVEIEQRPKELLP